MLMHSVGLQQLKEVKTAEKESNISVQDTNPLQNSATHCNTPKNTETQCYVSPKKVLWGGYD